MYTCSERIARLFDLPDLPGWYARESRYSIVILLSIDSGWWSVWQLSLHFLAIPREGVSYPLSVMFWYSIKASRWPQLPTTPSAAPYKHTPPPFKNPGTRIPCLISLYVERCDIECSNSDLLQKEGERSWFLYVLSLHTLAVSATRLCSDIYRAYLNWLLWLEKERRGREGGGVWIYTSLIRANWPDRYILVGWMDLAMSTWPRLANPVREHSKKKGSREEADPPTPSMLWLTHPVQALIRKKKKRKKITQTTTARKEETF